MRKKRFRFEKWWTKKADFQEVVSKAWGGEGAAEGGEGQVGEGVGCQAVLRESVG
jgi:hypothetical protein